MKIFRGQPVINLKVSGRLRFCPRLPFYAPEQSSLGPDGEGMRLHRAQEQVVAELDALYHRAKDLVGEHNASIFAIHALLVEDEDYQDAVHTILRTRNVTAESAVTMAGQNFAAAFYAMDDSYLRARAADIRHVSKQLVNALMHYTEPDPLGKDPAILVADEFSPTLTLTLDRTRLIGLVARKGSVNSHAAELARALNIPALVRVNVPWELDGHMAVLDGGGDRLCVDPSPSLLLEAHGVEALQQAAVQI